MREAKPDIDVPRLALRLRRLWVGTLYIAVFAIYAVLVGTLIVYSGWRPALLAVFVIGLIQLFRYVSDDVDRIGWLLRHRSAVGDGDDIFDQRVKLQYLLSGLIVSLNLLIVYQAYALSNWQRASLVLLSLVVVEMLFTRVRATNRRINYKSPVYGIRHADPITHRPQTTAVEEKLETLKAMAARGEISQKAFRRINDRELIRRVMEE